MTINIKERKERRKSNAFTSLTQKQISEIRETFDILDADDDKKISKADLLNFSEKFQNLSDQEITTMLSSLPEPTYISLLTYFADFLGNIDNEATLKNDLNNLVEVGNLKETDFCSKLGINESDRQLIFKGDVSKNGIIDISQLCVLLKHGELLENNKTVSEETVASNL